MPLLVARAALHNGSDGGLRTEFGRRSGVRERLMRKRDQQSGSSILATECGAFLDGTLAEYWDERGVVVPVWVWTNLLAHGSEELIAESVAGPSRPRRAARSWRIARSYLAYQMLDVTDARCPLSDLQRNVLVPLELDMAARPEVSRWGPARWVETVSRAIRNQHSSLEQ